ncbi:MAG: DNA polymerase I [Candidatus Omnitrophica bacterium]|nr:DNA polymerase I [Candidatus Omnitrophota bacterium]
MASAKAFLIDGTAFCYRAFYAIRALSTSDGKPTNAVYGFVTMLTALRAAHRPDYLAVAMDAGKPTFRHERYEAYKQHRKPMPDPLIGQLPLIRELLDTLRIPVFQMEGYEGEDLLATIARRVATEGVDVVLVTGDKDALQLVGPGLTVYNPHKDNAVFDAQAVEARYGVPPNRMVDLLALMGDATDNIPGVPGIGEKTAVGLLKRFGSLEGLYQRLPELPSRSQRQSLEASRSQVELARDLARIDADVPLTVRLEDLAVQEPDWERLRQLFKRLEFKRLLSELEAEHPPAISASTCAGRLVTDAASAAPVLARLKERAPVAVRDWWRDDAPAAVSLAWSAQDAWVIPVTARCAEPWCSELMRELASAEQPKLGHDLKRLLRWWRRRGDAGGGIAGDTMIAAYLLNSAQAAPTFPDTVEAWLQVRLAPVTPPAALAEDDLLSEQALPPSEVNSMAAHTGMVFALHEALERELERAQMRPLYRDLELPLIGVLADMEAHGIAVDREWLAAMRGRMQTTIGELTRELYRLAGCEFNLNSPKQLAEVLFERLKLPVIKRTKTGPSTDAEVLQRLATSHPLPQRLLEYRELSKLVSTYLDALPALIDPATGRLHTTFHQTGTATGRLSSSDPNLQNIPSKTELGRQIRKAFIPSEPAWVLTAADYSQIELRILAHLSHDETLIAAFQHDEDIHRAIAALIYHVPEAEVTPQMRYAMKAVNYGIIYGMSAHGLANELECSHEEAAEFIAAYFQRYPAVRAFLDAQIEQAKRAGYVCTALGRRRYIREIASPDPAVRQFAERMAVNAPIQGTAADLVKRAMLRLSGELQRRGLRSRLLLQVHDELVCEGPPDEADVVAALLRDTMEQALPMAVPIRVTLKRGPNWLELSDVAHS